MAHRYKPLDQQTVVVTGASSGIGLAAARRAARKGTQVVLASRSEEALREICDGRHAGMTPLPDDVHRHAWPVHHPPRR